MGLVDKAAKELKYRPGDIRRRARKAPSVAALRVEMAKHDDMHETAEGLAAWNAKGEYCVGTLVVDEGLASGGGQAMTKEGDIRYVFQRHFGVARRFCEEHGRRPERGDVYE